jgi:hypothetical protein
MPLLQSQDSNHVGLNDLEEKVRECFERFPNNTGDTLDSATEGQEETILQVQAQETDNQLEPDSVQRVFYDVDTYQPWNYALPALERRMTGLTR